MVLSCQIYKEVPTIDNTNVNTLQFIVTRRSSIVPMHWPTSTQPPSTVIWFRRRRLIWTIHSWRWHWASAPRSQQRSAPPNTGCHYPVN